MTDTYPIPPLTAGEIEQAMAWLTEWAKPCGVSWSGKHAAVILSALAELEMRLAGERDSFIAAHRDRMKLFHAHAAEMKRADAAEARLAKLERERDEWKAGYDRLSRLHEDTLTAYKDQKSRATSAEALSAGMLDPSDAAIDAFLDAVALPRNKAYRSKFRDGWPVFLAALSSPAPGEADQ